MAYDLMQNYPNPFNPSTSIGFTLPESGNVKVSVYDMTGRLVSTLVDANMDEGVHMVDWDGTDSSGAMVSAGVYIYALESSDMVMTKKMIVVILFLAFMKNLENKIPSFVFLFLVVNLWISNLDH